MSGVNKAIIIGRLGQDPELRQTHDGTAVCNLSVATSEEWTDKQSGEKQKRVEWHRIIVFNRQAEACAKYLAKGSQAYIEGRLQTRKWTDKDNTDRYTTEIVAATVQFLGSPGGANQTQPTPPPQQAPPAQESKVLYQPQAGTENDDIPF